MSINIFKFLPTKFTVDKSGCHLKALKREKKECVKVLHRADLSLGGGSSDAATAFPVSHISITCAFDCPKSNNLFLPFLTSSDSI